MSSLEQQLQRAQIMVAEMQAQNPGYVPSAATLQGLAPLVAPAPIPQAAPAPAPQAAPAPAPVDQQAQLQALVQQALPKLDKGVIYSFMAEQLKGVFKKALTEEELAFYDRHIKDGLPGITPFLASADIQSLAQLINETYRSFLSGKAN